MVVGYPYVNRLKKWQNPLKQVAPMIKRIIERFKMKHQIKLFTDSPTISEWGKNNDPGKDLIWREGVGSQCQAAEAINELLPGPPEEPVVISSHTSKSVSLPVMAFGRHAPGYDDLYFMAVMRNNFHDLCCQVVSSHEMNLPLSEVYTRVSREYMEEQRQKALGYGGFSQYHEKILKNPDDWSWWSEWSSGRVIQDGNDYYIVSYGWYEGFPFGGEYDSRSYYEGRPTKDFSFLADTYIHAASVFERAYYSARDVAIKKMYDEIDRKRKNS